MASDALQGGEAAAGPGELRDRHHPDGADGGEGESGHDDEQRQDPGGALRAPGVRRQAGAERRREQLDALGERRVGREPASEGHPAGVEVAALGDERLQVHRPRVLPPAARMARPRSAPAGSPHSAAPQRSQVRSQARE